MTSPTATTTGPVTRPLRTTNPKGGWDRSRPGCRWHRSRAYRCAALVGSAPTLVVGRLLRIRCNSGRHQVGLVVFSSQQVLAARVGDLLGHVGLVAQIVDSHDVAFQFRAAQELADGRQLIGLIGHCRLAGYQVEIKSSRDGFCTGEALVRVARVTHRLAIDGADLRNQFDFGHRVCLEHRWQMDHQGMQFRQQV